MFIPNDKKYLVYIKTAKTGGTTFVNILSQISPLKRLSDLKNIKQNDIIMIVYDQVKFFKERYPKIYKNSYKVIITRNPYDKTTSAWKYHPNIKDKKLLELLKNPTIPSILPSDI